MKLLTLLQTGHDGGDYLGPPIDPTTYLKQLLFWIILVFVVYWLLQLIKQDNSDESD